VCVCVQLACVDQAAGVDAGGYGSRIFLQHMGQKGRVQKMLPHATQRPSRPHARDAIRKRSREEEAGPAETLPTIASRHESTEGGR
jgi:hypothetical protein